MVVLERADQYGKKARQACAIKRLFRERSQQEGHLQIHKVDGHSCLMNNSNDIATKGRTKRYSSLARCR